MRALCTPTNPTGQFIYPGTQAPAPAPTPAPTTNLVPILFIGGGVLLTVMMMMSGN
jgi:hypothetical protein